MRGNRSKEGDLVVFQYQTGQLSGRKGPGVYVDAVRANVWLRHRRVPVNNDLAEVLFVKEKILADR